MDTAKTSGNGRYSCVNLQNYSTIEFRIFRGTLLYSTLIATLQLVDEICSVAVSMSDDGIAALTWSSFVAGLDVLNVPELVKYLRLKRLYINDLLAETEEDN